MSNKQYTECKRCGCSLIPIERSKGLCGECQERRTNIMRVVIAAFITMMILAGMIVLYFYANKKSPVSYEDCVMQVVDKREETTYRYAGKSIVPIKKYYLLFDDGEELRVSEYIHNKTDIDDYIIITYSYRNNNIEDMQIKFQN